MNTTFIQKLSRVRISIEMFGLIVLILCLSFQASAKTSEIETLQKARSQFSKGQLKQAAKTYGEIKKGSKFWLEALEEQAHTYGRLAEYNKTMANLKTVLAPQFEGLVGPEPYFVMGLTQLKVCDYTGALKTSKSFKDVMKKRITSLENLDAQAITSVFQNAQKSKKLSFDEIGKNALKLPRFTHRDRLAQSYSQKDITKFTKRIQLLAKAELDEINTNISKMQIIESEVIQKVNLLAHDGNRNKQGKFAKKDNTLFFPGDSEVWFDELGDFEAQVEKCPTLKQRASL